MNTRITYAYVDGANYHENHNVVIEGEYTEDEKSRILSNRYEDESFVPDVFGWPWGINGYPMDPETDHPMCDIDENSFELTDDPVTTPYTMSEVADMFEQCNQIGWIMTDAYMDRMAEIEGF